MAGRRATRSGPEETQRFFLEWAALPGVPPEVARRLRRRAKFYARGFRRLRVARTMRRRETCRAPRSPNRPRARSRRSAARGTARARDGDPDPEPPFPRPHLADPLGRARCWRSVERADLVRVPSVRLATRFEWYAAAGFEPEWLANGGGFRATCPACRAPGALVVYVDRPAKGAA